MAGAGDKVAADGRALDSDGGGGSSSNDTSSQTDPYRGLRQFGRFFAGLTFVALSTLVTRRAMARQRRYVGPPAAFYESSHRPAPPGGPPGGPMVAFEAFNIATVNVVSWSMMVGGGALWAFDISNAQELRARLRAGLGFDGQHKLSEDESNEEIEEWIAATLARREVKEGRRRRGGGGGGGGGDDDDGAAVTKRRDVEPGGQSKAA